MTTAGDIISEASAQLHGYGIRADRVTPLSAELLAGEASSFTVAYASGQATGISPGVVEIDSEQLYVTAVDNSTGACTLASGIGRGYNGTTAVTHAAGSKVVTRPKFPRNWLFKQLNEAVGAIFPDVFQVKTHSTTVTYPGNTYTLPERVGGILDVQWQDPVTGWQRVHSYSIDPFDGSFRLGDGPPVGYALRVAYMAEPALFTAESDNFTVTGLPPSCIDLLTLGVVLKAAPGLDIARAQQLSDDQSSVPAYSGVNVSKYLMALYQERLKNEAKALRRQYPPRIVRVSR